MNITDFEKIGLLVENDVEFFLVFQLGGTVMLNRGQHLRVFADALGAIKNDVFQVFQVGREMG
jgi:hypothetical protein